MDIFGPVFQFTTEAALDVELAFSPGSLDFAEWEVVLQIHVLGLKTQSLLECPLVVATKGGTARCPPCLVQAAARSDPPVPLKPHPGPPCVPQPLCALVSGEDGLECVKRLCPSSPPLAVLPSGEFLPALGSLAPSLGSLPSRGPLSAFELRQGRCRVPRGSLPRVACGVQGALSLDWVWATGPLSLPGSREEAGVGKRSMSPRAGQGDVGQMPLWDLKPPGGASPVQSRSGHLCPCSWVPRPLCGPADPNLAISKKAPAWGKGSGGQGSRISVYQGPAGSLRALGQLRSPQRGGGAWPSLQPALLSVTGPLPHCTRPSCSPPTPTAWVRPSSTLLTSHVAADYGLVTLARPRGL